MITRIARMVLVCCAFILGILWQDAFVQDLTFFCFMVGLTIMLFMWMAYEAE